MTRWDRYFYVWSVADLTKHFYKLDNWIDGSWNSLVKEESYLVVVLSHIGLLCRYVIQFICKTIYFISSYGIQEEQYNFFYIDLTLRYVIQSTYRYCNSTSVDAYTWFDDNSSSSFNSFHLIAVDVRRLQISFIPSFLPTSVTRFGDFFGLWATFLKPLATTNWPKSPTFLVKFCKGVKIFHFFSEINFGQLL